MLYRSAECIREPWLKKSLQENIEESIEEIPCVKNLPALPDYIKRRADLAIDLGIPIAVQFLATQLLLNQHGNFPLTATGLGLAFLLSLAGAVGVLHKGYQCYQEGNFCPMFQSKPKQDNVLVTNLLGS